MIAPLRPARWSGVVEKAYGSAGPNHPFRLQGRALGDKQTLVNDVFHSVASRYDLMNDLMSAGLHRVWKDIMINALNPPKGDAPFALLDVAGGTGDIAFRAAKAAGAGFHATVCDINPICSRSATIARWRIISTSRFPCRGQCRGLDFPDRSFDAYTIAFGIRNVPRIDAALREAYRVLRPGSRFCVWSSPPSTCRDWISSTTSSRSR